MVHMILVGLGVNMQPTPYLLAGSRRCTVPRCKVTIDEWLSYMCAIEDNEGGGGPKAKREKTEPQYRVVQR